MKIALAHDSFTQFGGAERVIEAFHEMYPEAPVFTLAINRRLKEKYKSWDIRTSWLQVFYNFIPKLQYFLPLIPLAVSSLDFSGYDLVLSSSSSFIKNVKLPKNCIHINYCHTPTRFLWSDEKYVNQEVPKVLRWLVRPMLSLMKKWDYNGAQRVNQFIANSQEVQGRIQRYYQRTSTVVYPFVDTEFWKPIKQKSDYFLIVGRLQAHKKNDLIVEIFSALGGSASGGNDSKFNLHVVGTGRQEEYLKFIAEPNIKFLGQLDDYQLREEYSGAKAVIYPQIEDFGLVPLEAAACNTPTLAYCQGGALETIIPGITGEFFESYDKEKIQQIILNWKPEKYRTEALQLQVEKFGKEKFKEKIKTETQLCASV